MRISPILFIATALSSFAAQAAFEKYEFEGTVSFSDGDIVSVGTPVEISFIYDTTAQGSFEPPNNFAYDDALLTYDVRIGPYRGRPLANGHSRLLVGDNREVEGLPPWYPTYYSDLFAFDGNLTSAEIDGLRLGHVVVSLYVESLPPPTAVEKFDLPLDLDFDDFSMGPGVLFAQRDAGLFFLNSQNIYSGATMVTLTSMTVTAVPEPETWLGMVAGLAFLGFALKRRCG